VVLAERATTRDKPAEATTFREWYAQFFERVDRYRSLISLWYEKRTTADEVDEPVVPAPPDVNPTTIRRTHGTTVGDQRDSPTELGDASAAKRSFPRAAVIRAAMTTDLERAVYLQRIDPNEKEAYVDTHDDVPPGVTDAMERAGVERFDLYVRDDIVICILEAEDIKAYDKMMADDAAVQEWERHVAQFKTDGVDVDAESDEQIPYMDRLWSFEP
jgi:L-rhamnose mutarotase